MIITAKRTTKPFEMFMDEYQETQYWNSQYSQLIGYKLVGVRWQKYPDWQGNDEYSEDPWPILIFKKSRKNMKPDQSEIIEVAIQQDPEGNGRGYLMGLEDSRFTITPQISWVNDFKEDLE